MTKYEYKTIELNLKGSGFFGPTKAEEFEATLNAQGAQGWRYADTVLQTGVDGVAFRLKLVFERELT